MDNDLFYITTRHCSCDSAVQSGRGVSRKTVAMRSRTVLRLAAETTVSAYDNWHFMRQSPGAIVPLAVITDSGLTITLEPRKSRS